MMHRIEKYCDPGRMLLWAPFSMGDQYTIHDKAIEFASMTGHVAECAVWADTNSVFGDGWLIEIVYG